MDNQEHIGHGVNSSETSRRDLVKAWESSGESQSSFSRKVGINRSTFKGWVSQYRSIQSDRQRKKSGTSGFIPLQLGAEKEPVDHPVALEIVLANGTLVRIFRSGEENR